MNSSASTTLAQTHPPKRNKNRKQNDDINNTTNMRTSKTPDKCLKSPQNHTNKELLFEQLYPLDIINGK